MTIVALLAPDILHVKTATRGQKSLRVITSWPTNKYTMWYNPHLQYRRKKSVNHELVDRGLLHSQQRLFWRASSTQYNKYYNNKKYPMPTYSQNWEFPLATHCKPKPINVLRSRWCDVRSPSSPSVRSSVVVVLMGKDALGYKYTSRSYTRRYKIECVMLNYVVYYNIPVE